MDDLQKQTLLQFFRAVGQETRLRIWGLLANRPHTVLELADVLEMKDTAVSNHLHRLLQAGLVTEEVLETGARYHLNARALAEWQALIFPEPEQEDLSERVLRVYVDGRKLRQLPQDLAEQQIILRWLADDFEPDKRYTETQVNHMLQRHYQQQDTLKQQLLAGHYLAQSGEIYWRPLAAQKE
ncbi:MAG: metalloregulator ArsR/SmtB family transcription factor [Chloroflexi bacterium]|nr:metalloregulator ArsR/SmtB family transcription factor [Chloroflexota bacterium]MBP7043560.1 metalloregulator ArsR/SmtB family transcription factor [Chloroflexota bacterium]